MEKKESLREIQILRAIAFIFVLLQHSIGGSASNLSLDNGTIMASGFIMTFAEPAVPIFLFISGLTLTYSYKDKLDLGRYYKNRICYLIIPYFIWSAVNMYWHNPDRLSDYFIQTIAGNGMFHLWYMGMIIRMVLVFPIIIYLGKFISKRHRVIKIATFIILFVGYHYVSANQPLIQNTIAEFLFGVPSKLEIKAVSLSFIFWGIYVVLGVYAGFNYELFREKVIKYRYVIYSCFIVFFFYKYQVRYGAVSYNRTADILYRYSNIIFFYLASYKLIGKIKIASVLNFIGKYSYVSYMIHIKVLYKFIFKFQGYGVVNPVPNSIIATALAAITASLIIFCISLIPKSRFITGVKDNYQLLLNLKDKFKDMYYTDGNRTEL